MFPHFEHCDEVWHAGDFGTIEVMERLGRFRPLRGVFGNIDGKELRERLPEKLFWYCENVRVYMTHIGGYPGKYAPGVRQALNEHAANLFICGHSHILKIIFDKGLQCLHINPGAAGKQGWHTMRTLVRFSINGSDISNCEVVELGKR